MKCVVRHISRAVLFKKRAVSRSLYVLGAGKLASFFLYPVFGLQNIPAEKIEPAEAIIVAPTAGCGINEIQFLIALQKYRSLVYIRMMQSAVCALQFPIELRRGNKHSVRANSKRVAHFGNVDILHSVYIAFPARPGKVQFSAILQNRAVYRPLVGSVENFAFQFIRGLRIGAVVVQNVHAVIAVVAVVARDINIAFVVYYMQFGCPKFLAVRFSAFGNIHDNRLGCRKPLYRLRLTHRYSARMRITMIKISVSVKYPRIARSASLITYQFHTNVLLSYAKITVTRNAELG